MPFTILFLFCFSFFSFYLYAPNKVKENSNIFLFQALFFVFVLYSLCCQLFCECIVAEIRIKNSKVCKCNTDADIEKTWE